MCALDKRSHLDYEDETNYEQRRGGLHTKSRILATPYSDQWPLNIQFLKKTADGGRNVEVSRTLLVVYL